MEKRRGSKIPPFSSQYFIICFLKVGNKLVILVIVDQVSKYTHFSVLQHPFSQTIASQNFLDQIFKLHGNKKADTAKKIEMYFAKISTNCMASQKSSSKTEMQNLMENFGGNFLNKLAHRSI